MTKVRNEKQYREVLRDLTRGHTINSVAKKYGLAEITIYKYIQEAQDRGKLERQYSINYIKKGKW